MRQLSGVNKDILTMLYAKKQYSLILDLAEKSPPDDFILCMAFSIYLKQGSLERASQAAAKIQDYEARRLREKSIEMWNKLHTPLVSEPRVHLMILTHNREEYVERALQTLALTKYKNYAVYIADNGSADSVLLPFLVALTSRIYAACLSFMAGVIPPRAILGRSLLYVHSHLVA